MTKRKLPPAARPKATARPRTLRDETRHHLLFSTATEWRRFDARATQAVTDAVSDLSASGLIEVRIVAAAEMGSAKTPKCRYVGGGEWWTLIEKELDRIIPATWIGKDGKPKEPLLKRANVVAIRLTGDGYDFTHAAKAGTVKKWIRTQPKTVETYLRCDGIATPVKTQSLTAEEMTILEVLNKEHPMGVTEDDLVMATRNSSNTVRKYLKRLRAKKLIDRPAGRNKGNVITSNGLFLIRQK